jgi:putative lipoic acid-binding regulatory protein
MMFDSVKVFSATKQKDRDDLGEQVTRWLREHGPSIEIVDKVVRQSSDSEYHCLSITLFYRRKA